jgi:hypothetical protein
MAAYAVIARIGRADPHLTLRDLDVDLDRDPPGSDAGLAADSAAIVEERPHEQSLGERLADQVFWVRESFGQLTFYLFDPDSWRR